MDRNLWGCFRIPPSKDFTAEIVVLITTLGVRRGEYLNSRRVMDKLETLRAHFKTIDFNMDTSGGGLRLSTGVLDAAGVKGPLDSTDHGRKSPPREAREILSKTSQWPPAKSQPAAPVVSDVSKMSASDEFNMSLDLEIIKKLYYSHRLFHDSPSSVSDSSPQRASHPSSVVNGSVPDGKPGNPQAGISLPQIIIDGVNIGDADALQALIDDGLLEGIATRELCPYCTKSRNNFHYCKSCKTLFQELMPGRQTIEELYSRMGHLDAT